ncbi:SBBP repeat-containing protein [Sorangium sp. So ce1024]|uniref:SBBP repeat-containing protein n=1 Tax=Sorangium sp. So ce1024 TaxID=3133327 RepID=UPI003F06CE00
MLENCETPADESCDGETLAYPGCHVWTRKDSADAPSVYNIAVDPSGNTIVVGDFLGTFLEHVSENSHDMFAAKLDPSGNLLWSVAHGNDREHHRATANDVAVDSLGNVYVTGSFNGRVDFGGGTVDSHWGGGDFWQDGFVVKLDPSGNHLWSLAFNWGSSRGSGIAVDDLGNVIVAGSWDGDAFVRKFNSGGIPLWSKRFNDDQNQYNQEAVDVAVDTLGRAVVAGNFRGQVNFGGEDLYSPAGTGFVLALDSEGGHVWSRMFGPGDTANHAVLYAVALDRVGGVFVTGDFKGSISFGGPPRTSLSDQDLFLVKLDSRGEHLWSKAYGTAEGTERGWRLASNGEDVFVLGQISGRCVVGDEGDVVTGSLFAARYNASGEHLWSHGYDSGGTLSPKGIAVDPNGGVLIAGELSGMVDLGGGPVSSEAMLSVFVTRLAP